MIKSMTAYAEYSTEHEGLTIGAEIKSYNSRHLDIVLRTPSAYRLFENQIKKLVPEYLGRGRVEIYLSVKDERSSAVPVYHVDEPRASACYEAMEKLQAATGIKGQIPIELVARSEGVISIAEPATPGTYEWDRIEEVIRKSLEIVDAMRIKEGQFLAADLNTRLDLITGMVDSIESQSEDLLAACHERLKTRIENLLSDTKGIDESRLAQEAAIIADKSDLSEEIVRAKSHVEQFRSAMEDSDPCGRKLNFLLQEFNREFNTMGSKTGNIDISSHVVAAKTELEKLREQVQNVE